MNKYSKFSRHCVVLRNVWLPRILHLRVPRNASSFSLLDLRMPRNASSSSLHGKLSVSTFLWVHCFHNVSVSFESFFSLFTVTFLPIYTLVKAAGYTVHSERRGGIATAPPLRRSYSDHAVMSPGGAFQTDTNLANHRHCTRLLADCQWRCRWRCGLGRLRNTRSLTKTIPRDRRKLIKLMLRKWTFLPPRSHLIRQFVKWHLVTLRREQHVLAQWLRQYFCQDHGVRSVATQLWQSHNSGHLHGMFHAVSSFWFHHVVFQYSFRQFSLLVTSSASLSDEPSRPLGKGKCRWPVAAARMGSCGWHLQEEEQLRHQTITVSGTVVPPLCDHLFCQAEVVTWEGW